MSDWSDGCDAAWALGVRIRNVPRDAPRWMHEMNSAAHQLAHDVIAEAGISVTCRLWLPGDENRLLPMPLRYAAPQIASPTAILDVLTGGRR